VNGKGPANGAPETPAKESKAQSTTRGRAALGLTGCPDCSAVEDAERLLTHDHGCPVGADLDAMRDDDADWFLRHPGVTIRRRALRWGEQVALELALRIRRPEGATWHGNVEVRNLADGVRAKSFANVVLVLTPGRPS
jgi:hypothetical protein